MPSASRSLFSNSVVAGARVCAAATALHKGFTQMSTPEKSVSAPDKTNPYVGMWVTADGHIRHNLLPNGRYDEARGRRESAYQGRYEIRGNHIDYWDDTGFTADGEFRGGILYHAGMVLYREEKAPR
ncbi:hypothetical protein predicted by Glimmer/Critica (plasmid) [Sinorhizobium fredii HH103]|uniref:Agrobacterium tumefaciens protein Atu4866 n=2 Tax=Rhizobium fredii TaxID=380 RepID=G9AFZ3_SINF1|nr:hypothetical protein predicted by Glimmer/Critica [Sinorhizobium fredii HH103]